MTTFSLPDLGEGLHEATVIEWYAQAGDTLRQGDRLLAVETAKAVVEIPAPEALTIDAVLAEVDTVIKVGAPLLRYARAGASPAAHEPTAAPASVSVVGVLPEAAATTRVQTFVAGPDRFSAEEQARADRMLRPQAIPATSPSPPRLPRPGQPLSGARLTMSQLLGQAHGQVALVTLFDSVRVNWKAGTKPLPRLVRALCAGCRAEPALNAWFDGEQLLRHEQVDVGVAMDTPHGLYVPVLRGADALTLVEIEDTVKSLRAQARARQLQPAQLQGATISLSNFGMLAGRFATAMVLPPQVAILAVGAITPERYLSRKGRLKSAQVIPLSLSFDHRALTGGEAARFLAAVMADLAGKH